MPVSQPAITLQAPVQFPFGVTPVVPPITVPAVSLRIATDPMGGAWRSEAPALSVPRKFPEIVVPVPETTIPSRQPLITLRAADDVPPIVAFVEPMRSTQIPKDPEERAAVPAAFNPMKLPATTLPEPPTRMAGVNAPPITLQAPVHAPPGLVPAVPPIVLLSPITTTSS